MLVLIPRGGERTEGEFAEVFAKGGFRLTRVVPTLSPRPSSRAGRPELAVLTYG
jgi:hypothetical protein